jgi:hypothetical protein
MAKRSVTFELPPSPRCVIQRHKVILSIADAFELLCELKRQLGELHVVENEDQSRPREDDSAAS